MLNICSANNITIVILPARVRLAIIAELIYSRAKSTSYKENVVGLGVLTYLALSFLPLNFNYIGLSDSAACFTLDFAPRIVTPTVELEKWYFREWATAAASVGQPYSEQR